LEDELEPEIAGIERSIAGNFRDLISGAGQLGFRGLSTGALVEIEHTKNRVRVGQLPMHWYLIHTKPRQERVALQNLEKQQYGCYLPVFSSEKIRRGGVSVVDEPLFPRYLFIQLDTALSSQSWTPIRSTKGVSRMVSFGNRPAVVDDAIVAWLRESEKSNQGVTQTIFNPGDSVQIAGGAFDGIEGVYQMKDGDARAMVLIEILSKKVSFVTEHMGLRKVGV
jgi:transcriptional antiterminator RfaH